jgi:hypothetical protein
VAAVATAALALTVAVKDGPFASGGALNSLLYRGFVLWLIPTTVVVFRRLRPGAGHSST